MIVPIVCTSGSFMLWLLGIQSGTAAFACACPIWAFYFFLRCQKLGEDLEYRDIQIRTLRKALSSASNTSFSAQDYGAEVPTE